MAKLKFTIKCVNKGKPFEMPNWTTEKHEAALAKLANDQKLNGWSEKRAENEFKYYVIHETMIELDPDCTMKALKEFLSHPSTLLELFNAVYNAGRENIYYVENFRKGRKTQNTKK